MIVSLVRRRSVNMRGPCPVLHVFIYICPRSCTRVRCRNATWRRYEPSGAAGATSSDILLTVQEVELLAIPGNPYTVCCSPIYPLVRLTISLLLFALPDEGVVWIIQFNSEGWSVICRKKIRRNVLEEIWMDEITIVVVIIMTNLK